MMQFLITEPRTKEVVFERVFLSRDSATLEQLKELSCKRKVIEEFVNKSSQITGAIAREIAGGITSRPQQDLQKLEQYLPLLENFVHHVDLVWKSNNVPLWTSELKIRWSSGLSSSSLFHIIGPKFFQINNVRFELCMILFLYGIKLRERALEIKPADLMQCTTLYREAAGVFHHLAHEVLPHLKSGEKPPEAAPSVCFAMSSVCLAEGQAATVERAEAKGTSISLLAKLHYGVTQLLSEATSLLNSATEECQEVASNVMEYISTLSALHELKSQKYHAAAVRSKEKIGIAIGVLRDALSNGQKKVPREDSWKTIFKREIDDIADSLRKYEYENDFVWHENTAGGDELPSPQGNKIVNILPYSPKRWERELLFKL